jgi:hypothetical protein
MSLRRPLSMVVVVVLASQLAGCSWWHKRKVKKDLEGVKDPATAALTAMKDADAKVIKARNALSSASKAGAGTDALVEKIHDFAVALQGAVPAAKKFGDAVEPLETSGETTIEAIELAGTVEHAQLSFVLACGHELAFDDIDPCGAAYDDMLGAAYVFQERAKDYDVAFPIVRAPEKD